MFTATVFSEERGFLALSQRADILDGTEPQGTRQKRARNRLISAHPYLLPPGTSSSIHETCLREAHQTRCICTNLFPLPETFQGSQHCW